MKNFITATDTNTRFASEHAKLRDNAVHEINQLIAKASEFPVLVPKALFTDNLTVKHELMRKLSQESHWEIVDGEELVVAPHPGPRKLDHYYLYYRPVRRDTELQRLQALKPQETSQSER